MLVRHFRDPHWLVNSYLVVDHPGGSAVLIDSGGPMDLLLAECERLQVVPEVLLNTHRHPDHVIHNLELAERFSLAIGAHALEAGFIPGVDFVLAHQQELQVGELNIKVLHVPGHTAGHLAFVIDSQAVFTGDVLFRGSVGGTRGFGHTSIDDLRESIVQKLMTLPPTTLIYPGHMDSSDVHTEWQENRFIRWWRGLEVSMESACLAAGQPATLLLRVADYDGGSKCLVRFVDLTEDLVAGSKVLEFAD